MGVSNPGGGGAPANLSGTAAARPTPAAAGANRIYWATDTDEITFSDGSAWHVIRQSSVSGWFSLPSGSLSVGTSGSGQIGFNQGSGILLNATGLQPFAAANVINQSNNTNTSSESATATTGASGAPPAQVAGYFVCINRGAQTVKVPYYAN